MRFFNIYTSSLLILISMVFIYFYHEFLLTDIIIEDHLKNQLSLNRIQELLKVRDQYSWINSAIIPITYLLKFTVISLWLLSGTILFEYNSTFKSIFQIVILAEFVWLIPSFLTFIWFGFIETGYTFLDIQYLSHFPFLVFLIQVRSKNG